MVFFIFEFLIAVCDFLPLALVDEDVVEVSEVGQFGDEMGLVLSVSLAVLNGEGIAIYIEYLKILEACFLLGLSPEVGDNFLKGCDLVIANGEDIQFSATIQSINS